jgi:hypothetical protein
VLQVLSRLIKGYNFRFQPRSHAVDLVETLHVVLGMLDRLSSSGEWLGGRAAARGHQPACLPGAAAGLICAAGCSLLALL